MLVHSSGSGPAPQRQSGAGTNPCLAGSAYATLASEEPKVYRQVISGPGLVFPAGDSPAVFPRKSAKIRSEASQPIPVIGSHEFRAEAAVGQGRMVEIHTNLKTGIGSKRSQLLRCYADLPILLSNSSWTDRNYARGLRC